MRIQLASLMVFGMVVTASPALAQQKDRDSGPRFLEGALIGTAIPVVAVTVSGILVCPSVPNFGFGSGLCIVSFVLGGVILTPLGALLGGLTEYLITVPKGPPPNVKEAPPVVPTPPSVMLVPAFSGRDAASLNLVVRF